MPIVMRETPFPGKPKIVFVVSGNAIDFCRWARHLRLTNLPSLKYESPCPENEAQTRPRLSTKKN